MVGMMKGEDAPPRPRPLLPGAICCGWDGVGGRSGKEAQKVEVAEADAKRLVGESDPVPIFGLPLPEPDDPSLDLNQSPVSENAWLNLRLPLELFCFTYVRISSAHDFLPQNSAQSSAV